MRATRRAQIPMNPEEIRRLRNLARGRKTTVGELIRTSVRMPYFTPGSADKQAALEATLQMNRPAIDWRRAKREIEAGMGKFLDINISLEAAGEPHPERAAGGQILRRVAGGTLDATADTEVIGEMPCVLTRAADRRKP